MKVLCLLSLVLAGLACGPHAVPSTPGAAAAEPAHTLGFVLDDDPNGLWWDAATQELLIATGLRGRVLSWTEAEGTSILADLGHDAVPGADLGQLVRTADGAIVVTRFGDGKRGGVTVIPPSGEPRAVSGVDPSRHRIGLTLAPGGQLFDAWFQRVGEGRRIGAISRISIESGDEYDVMTGLEKPVGVLALGDQLIVSDQRLGRLLRAPLANLSARGELAELERPDLLAAGPDGAVFSGSASGRVYRVESTGAVSVVYDAESEFEVRGVACDLTARRLFVAEHDPAGRRHGIRLVPFD